MDKQGDVRKCVVELTSNQVQTRSDILNEDSSIYLQLIVKLNFSLSKMEKTRGQGGGSPRVVCPKDKLFRLIFFGHFPIVDMVP